MSPGSSPVESGDEYRSRVVLSPEVVADFARFSGDDNPLHLDVQAARSRGFATRVAHGGILLAEISRVIGTELPGRGSLWLSSDIEFLAPAYVGDTVVVEAVVEHASAAVSVVVLRLRAWRESDHTMVLEGSAKVQLLEETMPIVYKPLDKQRVVVSGGTRGLGRTITLALLEAGASVTALYRSDEAAAATLTESAGAGGDRLATVQCDVTRSEDVAQAFEAIEAGMGGVDSFVHAASPRVEDIPLSTLDWSAFQPFLETYIKGSLEIIQRCMPHFEQEPGGRVVLIGSEAAQAPKRQWAHYVTAKSAYLGFVRALSVELADIGATANLVSPGAIHTSDVLSANVKAATKNATPLKRLVTEEEVTEVVLFLLEKGGSFISGSNIPLSGGRVFLA